MKILKRKTKLISSFLAVLLIISSAAFLSACGSNTTSSNSGLKGTIVVTTYGGTYDEVFNKCVVKPFEKKYPGVKVKLSPYISVAKLQNGGAKNVDIVSLDDFDIIDAGNKGLLTKLKSSDFSNWNKLYPQAFLKTDKGDTVGLSVEFGAWGIAYNSKEISKPSSWNVFWDPEVKGKAAMMSQYIPDIIMTEKSTNSSDDNMAPVWEAFKKLTPSIAQYYSSFSSPESLFNSNSIVISSWFNGRAIALEEKNPDIKFTIPKEGGVLIRGAEGIVSSSKNKEIAEKFIDFRLNADVQTEFSKNLYYGPTNKEAKLSSDLVDKGITYGDEKIKELTVPDWNKLLSQREELLGKWTEATSK
jgi:putative spermidine/putrescine transport system substrate-binding protein